MKVLVSPGALRFVRAVREESPANHMFGWLVGVSASGGAMWVLDALYSTELASAATLDDQGALSLPRCEREHATLHCMLPAGLQVLGCFCTGSAAAVAAAVPAVATQMGASPSRFLVCSLDPQSAALSPSWGWAAPDAPAPAVTVEPALARRFCTAYTAVALRCVLAPGRAVTDLQSVLLQLVGSARTLDPQSKQALSSCFAPTASSVDVENGMDLVRQIRVLHRHQAPADAPLPQLVVPSPSAAKPASLDAFVLGYFSPDATVAAVVAQLVDRLNHVEWVWRMHGADAADETAAFRPPDAPFALGAFKVDGDTTPATRRELARRLGLPPKWCLFRAANQIDRVWDVAPTKPLDVHAELLGNHGVRNGRLHCISGHYEYCHYMQGNKT